MCQRKLCLMTTKPGTAFPGKSIGKRFPNSLLLLLIRRSLKLVDDLFPWLTVGTFRIHTVCILITRRALSGSGRWSLASRGIHCSHMYLPSSRRGGVRSVVRLLVRKKIVGHGSGIRIPQCVPQLTALQC